MAEPATLAEITATLPPGGLFRKQSSPRLPWLLSPRPLELNAKQSREILSLGHILGKFYDVCDDLYQSSAKGKIHPWISHLLDTGKPEWLINLQRSSDIRSATPKIIRPDLMLSATGFHATELDSVPGGIGITQWLSSLYAGKGWNIAGGSEGMATGFREIFPDGADILVSEESADYLPEMAYFASELGEGFSLHKAETYESAKSGKSVYRFFELFDLPNIPGSGELLNSLSKTNALSPPAKPHFEEKLWMALFHTPGLRTLWKTRLRESHHARLEQLFPHSWVMDPAPLPPQAALPWLNLNSWDEVKTLSQKQRRLVVKISGFSERAWGARGVSIGHDLPTQEWSQVLTQALEEYSTSPWVMQEFIPSIPIDHPYFDPETGTEKILSGFARICPYYFRLPTGDTWLGGCLATIVPKDKKKIHGMSDAILVPCSLSL